MELPFLNATGALTVRLLAGRAARLLGKAVKAGCVAPSIGADRLPRSMDTPTFVETAITDRLLVNLHRPPLLDFFLVIVSPNWVVRVVSPVPCFLD